LHPVTIAAALGLIGFFLLPAGLHNGQIQNKGYDFIIECLSMLKNLVAPLSMTVIGLRLADISFKGFFKDKNLYVFLALRHILLPAAVFFIMYIITLLGLNIDKQVITVVLIMASAPAASSATMFAEKYDCDAAYVSKLVAASTILSLLTMPLMALLINMV
jgi:predicted permease